MLSDTGITDCGGLNADLLGECGAHFRGSVLREILFAAAGLKVSRLSLAQADRARLAELGDRYGFSMIDGRMGYLSKGDAGKGGFVNKARFLPVSESVRSAFSYVSRSADVALLARERAESGNSNGFGELLGIPECCRGAYDRFEPAARRSQGDLLPWVWKNTPEGPFDPWINIAVRYFGAALISFFPCSFRCSVASSIAQDTWRRMASISAEWADSFLKRQNANVLYTEQRGVHLFESAVEGNSIRYSGSCLRSTENTSATRLLRGGDRMEILSGQSVAIYNDRTLLGTIRGPGVFVCLFRLPELTV